MDSLDEFKYLVSGYYGVVELNNYDEKVYILKDIEEYIKDFVEINNLEDDDLESICDLINDSYSKYRKLQDSLLVLPKVKAPLDIILTVKKELKELKEKDGIHDL